MTLVERLEALAKQKSRRLGEQLVQGGYRVEMADERDLLEEAAKEIRTQQRFQTMLHERGCATWLT